MDVRGRTHYSVEGTLAGAVGKRTALGVELTADLLDPQMDAGRSAPESTGPDQPIVIEIRWDSWCA